MQFTTYSLKISIAFSIATALTFTGWSQNLNNPTSDYNQVGVTELYDFIVQLDADKGSLERFYAIPNAPERRIRFNEFYQDQLRVLQAMDFEKLSTGGQVDYLLMQRFIKDQLKELQTEEDELNQLSKYLDFGDYLYELEKERRRGKHLDSKKVAIELDQLTKNITKKQEALKDDPKTYKKLSPELSERVVKTVDGQIKALYSVYEFYNGFDPKFSWWVEKPKNQLHEALKTYKEVLSARVDSSSLPSDDGSGIIGNPVGKKNIEYMLQYEMIPYSPEELIEIANKEFEWCDQEVRKVSKEMGFGIDWKKALEKVKNTYVEEGYQPETMARLYDESVAFLKEKDLISIPPIAEETWRMKMLSPEQQKRSPFFLGGEVLQIAFPTNDMDHEYKMMSMRGNNPHFARAVIHHELIAGHHLQMFSFNRYKSYRDYYTPFWVEGWALYWEMVLWDEGFPQTPEDKMGMLFWRMHRCARIIFSLNYHLKKWTPQQCIDFLVDRVGHERANAEGEVRRSFTGGYGPLYQIAYMTGGLQFYQLRKELVSSGKMSNKEFHQKILQENSMPVEMVRAILTQQKLTKDYTTSWKFYSLK